MMNPATQRPGNNSALAASVYPAAYAMAVTSNPHFSLTAQRLVLPALPVRRPRPDPWPDYTVLQFRGGARAATHPLAA